MPIHLVVQHLLYKKITSLNVWVDGVGVHTGLTLEGCRQVLNTELGTQPEDSAHALQESIRLWKDAVGFWHAPYRTQNILLS